MTPLLKSGFYSILVLSVIRCGPPPETQGEIEDIKKFPVEVQVMKLEEANQVLSVSSVLEPVQSVDLIAEVSGKVVQINKELGDYVSLRDTLARIDDHVLENQYFQALAQLASAQSGLSVAELNFNSDQQLYKTGDISEYAFENSKLQVRSARASVDAATASLSAARKSWQDTRITSPIAGRISRKAIQLGTMVSPGMMVYRVVDLVSLKAQVGIPQSAVQKISPGNPVTVSISALKTTFKGTVRYISPEADGASGTFAVEIHLANTPDQRIKPGMTAQLDILMTTEQRQLVVEDFTLINKDGQEHLYVVENGLALLKPVEVSEIIGTRAIITSGLEAGDTIVTVGMKNLGNQTPVFIERVIGE